MIKIDYKENLITISGHANYSNGNDIVCASVSSIMYTTVNALLRLDESSIKYTDNKDKVTIEILKHNETIDTLKANSELTEDMKNTDPLKWVGIMNAIKNQAEEIVYNEIICI